MSIPACKLGCNSGRSPCRDRTVCQTDSALPPVLAWIRREFIARSQMRRWYVSFRKGGFSRRRSLFLAWRTTRPIQSKTGGR